MTQPTLLKHQPRNHSSLEKSRTSAFYKKYALIFTGIFVLVFSLTLGFGASGSHIFWEMWRSDQNVAALARTIFWDIRLPRSLMCCLIGGSVSVAGVLSQGLFRNALASPSVIGTSSGGTLAVVLVMYLELPFLFWVIPIAGCLGALMTTILMIYWIQSETQAHIERILLIGFSINTLVGAITSFLLSLSLENFQKAPLILNWMMGTFSGKGWEHVLLALIPMTVGLFLSLKLSYRLNVLSLGHEIAQSMGVSWPHLRKYSIVAIAILIGTSVSLVGLLPFLGLIVPHITRRLIGSEHRMLLIFSFINGMSLTLFTDFLVRYLWQPRELQVGILIALIGSPLFLWLLWKERNSQSSY